MPPYSGKCEAPEKQVPQGVITVAAKRSCNDNKQLVKKEEASEVSDHYEN